MKLYILKKYSQNIYKALKSSFQKMSDEQSLIPRLQRAYRQLRKSRLVKKTDPRQTDEEALQHFVSILNSALPRAGNPAEQAVDEVVKMQYFDNPHGFIRSLHRKKSGKNPRKEVRCLVLLTIGLEIVREFELEKVVHLHWNNEAREYNISIVGTSPKPARTETGEVEELEQKVRRLEEEMVKMKTGGSDGEQSKNWAEMTPSDTSP